MKQKIITWLQKCHKVLKIQKICWFRGGSSTSTNLEILVFSRNILRGSGDGAESPGLSIDSQTNQIWIDLAVFWSGFGAGSFVICVAGGFRGVRLGGFPAFLGLGFGGI